MNLTSQLSGAGLGREHKKAWPIRAEELVRKLSALTMVHKGCSLVELLFTDTRLLRAEWQITASHIKYVISEM